MQIQITISRAIATQDTVAAQSNGLGYPLVSMLSAIVGRPTTLDSTQAVSLANLLPVANSEITIAGDTTGVPVPPNTPIVGDTVSGSPQITNIGSLVVEPTTPINVALGWLLDSAVAGFPAGSEIINITPGPPPYTITMSAPATSTTTSTSFDFLVGPPYNQIVNVPSITNNGPLLAGGSPPWTLTTNGVPGLFPIGSQVRSVTGGGPYVVTLNSNATATTVASSFGFSRIIDASDPYILDPTISLGFPLVGSGLYVIGPNGFVPFTISNLRSTLITQKTVNASTDPTPTTYTEVYDSFVMSGFPATSNGTTSSVLVTPIQRGGVTATGTVQNVPLGITSHAPTAIGNIASSTSLQNFAAIGFNEQLVLSPSCDLTVATPVAPTAGAIPRSIGTLTTTFDLKIDDSLVLGYAGAPLYMLASVTAQIDLTYTWNTAVVTAQRYTSSQPTITDDLNQVLVVGLPTPYSLKTTYVGTAIGGNGIGGTIDNTATSPYDFLGEVTTLTATSTIADVPSVIPAGT